MLHSCLQASRYWDKQNLKPGFMLVTVEMTGVWPSPPVSLLLMQRQQGVV